MRQPANTGDPLVADPAGSLDSSLILTHALLEIFPAGIIILASPFYIYKACHSAPVCRGPKAFFMKLALATALVSIQVASAALWWRLTLDTSLSQVAALMTCLTAICVWVMVYIGHLHFARAPSFLSIFLSATLLCDAAITNIYFRRTGLDALARFHLPIPLLKLALVILEEISKRMLSKKEHSSSRGPEAITNFWTKSLIQWTNAILLIGFRRIESQQDLASIDQRFDAEKLQDEFVLQWGKIDQESDTALLEACFYTIPSVFVSIILPRIVTIVFNYAQPFLLGEVVHAVGLTNLRGSIINGLLSATVLVYSGRIICSAWYRYIKNQISVSVRAILMGAIYRKSLRLSAEESVQSAAASLMSTDVNTIEKIVTLSYESGGALLEITVGLIALRRHIGSACIFTLIPAILVSFLSTKLSKRMHAERYKWDKHTMERMADTSNALAQIKEIKMMGLGPVMAKRLQAKQTAEIAASMGERAAWSAIIALAAFVETVTPTAVIGATIFWTKSLNELSAPNFFSVLALIAMIATPLSFLLGNLGYWPSGFASLARIQSYLLQDEVKDPRVLVSETALRATAATRPPVSEANTAARRSRSRRRSRQILFAVQMANVAVTYDTSGPVLRDIGLNFPINRRTMIFGSTGCGKTTFLKALLSEVTVRGGSISLVSKCIAYCGQTPFIQVATIKCNIIGPNAFDAAWFRRVMWICALEAEVNSLSNGIDTFIGGDDCSLSDGQNLRISLARALYFKPEILLLDDVFSCLDMETSSTIRIRLFSQTGVLRSNSITLIMTTSMTAHLVDADIVVGLTIDGKATVLSNGIRQTSPSDFPASILPPQRVEPEVIAVDEIPNEKGELPTVKLSNNTEAPWKHPSSRYGDFSLYWYFLRPAAFWFLIPWTAAVSIAALVERMPQLYVRYWLDRNPESRFHYVAYLLFGLAGPLCNFIAGESYYCLVNPRTTEGLHWKLVDMAFKTQLDSLTRENAESLLKRLSLDIVIVSQRLPLGIMPTCWMAVTVLIDAWMISSGANHLAPIMTFFLLLLAGLQYFYLETSRNLRFIELNSSRLLHNHFTRTITGIEYIRAFQWQSYSQMEFYSILETAQNAFYSVLSIQQWLQVILNISCMAVALVVISLALKSPDTTSQPTLGLALLSLITFSDTMRIFIDTWTHTETNLGAVARTRSFVQLTPQEKDRKRVPAVPELWPSSGKVDFSCVSAEYLSQSAAPCTALKNISVSIGAREKVAITGPRGSGKSSVFVCLLSLLQYSGSISIDDREIRAVPRDILRSRITTITQSGLELAGSVRFNLNPFGFASVADGLLTDVLRRVGLLRVVDSRGGLMAAMGEMKFLRAQKFLFEIARAIVHKQATNSRLVLIDEGSLSLDEETETRVQALLDKEFSDCTLLIATHRSRALENIDVLLRLENGGATIYRLNRESGQVVQVR